jgi:uncharacterized membrane protein
MRQSRSECEGKETTIMTADWGILARAVHVLAVVIWIGGVWLVTTVLLPGMKGKPPEEWRRDFDALEHRFAPQARIAALLVLLSGLYMLYHYDLWDRFMQGAFWWMHLMVGVWLLFAALLFVIEPLIVRRIVYRRAASAPEATLARMIWLHRVMLALSLLAIFAAVAGSQGLF